MPTYELQTKHTSVELESPHGQVGVDHLQRQGQDTSKLAECGAELTLRSFNVVHEDRQMDESISTLLRDSDIEWSGLQKMVQLEGCKLIEYSYLNDGTLAVWVVDKHGKLLCSKMLKSVKGGEGPSVSIQQLVVWVLVSMSVLGREVGPHGRDDEQLLQELVLHLENNPGEDMPKALSGALAGFLSNEKKSQVLQEARAECKQVHRWLDTQFGPNRIDRHVVENLIQRTSSWAQIKTWTDKILRLEYEVADPSVRNLVLEQVSYHFDAGRLLSELYSRLVQPISDVLGGKGEEILIIPDRDLFSVPWAALQNEHGEYLVEHQTIRIAPSLRLARAADQEFNGLPRFACRQGHPVHIRTTSARSVCDKCYHDAKKHNEECALASQDVGIYYWCPRCNIDFCQKWSDDSNVTDSESKAIVVGNPLPNRCGGLQHAEEEAVHVSASLRQSDSFSRVEVGIRQDATKTWFLENACYANWVHVALHARIDDDSLVMADVHDFDEGLSMNEIQNRMTLAPGSTVILSACNTARGQIKCEGVIGLARGFLAAKAGSVVASLWSVQDESTKILMLHFYAFLQTGMAVPQALRHAMLKMCARHPIEQRAESGARDGSERVALPHDTPSDESELARMGRGGPRKDLRGYRPVRTLTSPLHWAGFLVTGASTRLPSL